MNKMMHDCFRARGAWRSDPEKNNDNHLLTGAKIGQAMATRVAANGGGVQDELETKASFKLGMPESPGPVSGNQGFSSGTPDHGLWAPLYTYAAPITWSSAVLGRVGRRAKESGRLSCTPPALK